ncbi:MAG: N-acetyltransferase family protein [Phycisphaerae bacterium]
MSVRTSQIAVRTIMHADRDWISALFTQHFGGPEIDSRDESFDTCKLPGLVAEIDGRLVAALSHTPMLPNTVCEIIALASAERCVGAGSALLDACIAAARVAGCSRLFLTTGNDNTPALRFYQKRGWRIVAIHRDAMTRARVRKPTLPLTGHDGILIADELELEYALVPFSPPGRSAGV